jgi:hypothetical protein
MSPVRGAGSDDHYADRNDPRRNAAAAALGADDDDEVRGTPDVFDAPIDDLKAKLSDMTNKLGSLVDKDEAPQAPVAEQADIDIDVPVESSGMSRLVGRTDDAADSADAPDEPATAADRVALSLGTDDSIDDPTDEAFEAPEMMLGQRVLQGNFDGDVNDNGIMDKFEDDLADDDGSDGDDGGLEFASLDFDGD